MRSNAARLLVLCVAACLSPAAPLLVVDYRPIEAFGVFERASQFYNWTGDFCGEDCYRPASDEEPIRARTPEEAQAVWDLTSTCLRAGGDSPCDAPPASPHPPSYAEAFAHYKQVLAVTAKLRGRAGWSDYGGYTGPWLENVFLRRFFSLPYAAWYPLIPVFVEWTDVNIRYTDTMADHYKAWNATPHRLDSDKAFFNDVHTSMPPNQLLYLFSKPAEEAHRKMRRAAGVEEWLPHWSTQFPSADTLWRADMRYLIVLNYDNGPLAIDSNCSTWRNFLIIGSGGWGNAPIPMLKPIPGWTRPDNTSRRLGPEGLPHTLITDASGTPRYTVRRHLASFVGMLGYPRISSMPPQYRYLRQRTIAALRNGGWGGPGGVLAEPPQPGNFWADTMLDSAFTIAFRGYGPTSYRLYEALSMGRVPLYVFKDVVWLPFPRAPEKLWGPGGVAFQVEADLVSAFVHNLCMYALFPEDMIASGIVPPEAIEAVLRQLPGNVTATMPPSVSTACVRDVALNATGPHETFVIIKEGSALAAMEQRLVQGGLIARYFSAAGIVRQIGAFVRNPQTSAMVCEPKTSVATRASGPLADLQQKAAQTGNATGVTKRPTRAERAAALAAQQQAAVGEGGTATPAPVEARLPGPSIYMDRYYQPGYAPAAVLPSGDAGGPAFPPAALSPPRSPPVASANAVTPPLPLYVEYPTLLGARFSNIRLALLDAIGWSALTGRPVVIPASHKCDPATDALFDLSAVTGSGFPGIFVEDREPLSGSNASHLQPPAPADLCPSTLDPATRLPANRFAWGYDPVVMPHRTDPGTLVPVSWRQRAWAGFEASAANASATTAASGSGSFSDAPYPWSHCYSPPLWTAHFSKYGMGLETLQKLQAVPASACVGLQSTYLTFPWHTVSPETFDAAVEAIRPHPGIAAAARDMAIRLRTFGRRIDSPLVGLHLRQTDMAAAQGPGFLCRVGADGKPDPSVIVNAVNLAAAAAGIATKPSLDAVVVLVTDEYTSPCVQAVIAALSGSTVTLLGADEPLPTGNDPCSTAAFLQDVLAHTDAFVGTAASSFSVVAHQLRVIQQRKAIATTIFM